MPWWLSWTLENTRPSTCPAFGPPELRERYKQTCVSVSVCLYCLYTALHTVSGCLRVNKLTECVYTWESLWSCMGSQLSGSSLETTRDTAVSVLTGFALFSFEVKHKLFTSPSTHSWIFIHRSVSRVPSSPRLHISLVSQNDRGNKFDHLVAPL